MKVTSPDYEGSDKEKAVEDFKHRIEHYMVAYEPLDEKYDRDYSFIKIFNQGEKFLVNRVQGEYNSCSNIVCIAMIVVGKHYNVVVK